MPFLIPIESVGISHSGTHSGTRFGARYAFEFVTFGVSGVVDDGRFLPVLRGFVAFGVWGGGGEGFLYYD